MLFTIEPIRLNISDADVRLFNAFISEKIANDLMQTIVAKVPWRQDDIVLFGKSVPQPRLTAWYGDNGKAYTYSGLTMQPIAWNDELLMIKGLVENVANVAFNSVLVNYYRNGNDSMGWHSDDEKVLGTNPVIASVSLGQQRVFKLKHRFDPTIPIESIMLTNGSLLLMAGATQHYWKHALPKSAKNNGARINLTFRHIL